ncbi:MAG: hypothetical protein EOO20_12530 [Chryseobacterium sp.]|nr:MAG: hypothetical protein EOO20_12530 [Chryseobacterium sp.]
MDYLADLENFFEDIRAGIKEARILSASGYADQSERMKGRVKFVALRSKVLIEKMLEPNIGKLLETKVALLPIPTRAINALHAYGIMTLADLLRMALIDVTKIPGLGSKSTLAIQKVIKANNLPWELLKSPGIDD